MSISTKRLKFLYDINGVAIGKYDEDGVLFTLSGDYSYEYVRMGNFTKLNGAHLERLDALSRQAPELLGIDEEE